MRLLLVIASIMSCSLYGQTMRFSHIDQKQGLSQNTVMAVLQDREGFIWVGTQDGLNRYDGYTFAVYRKITSDTNSLPDNFIMSLAEDSDGNIWVGTRNGICVYVKSTDKFYRYYSPLDDRKQYHQSITTLFSYRDGGVIYRTLSAEIIRVSFNLFSAEKFSGKVVAVNTGALGYCFATNKIAVVKGPALFVFVDDTSARVNYSPIVNHHEITFLCLTEEYIYLNDGKSITSIPVDQKEMARTLFECDANVTSIQTDLTGTLWVGTNSGLHILHDPQHNGVVEVIRENPSDYFSIIGDRIECIYESSEGIMWIGTVGGLNTYDPRQRRFSILSGSLSNLTENSAVWFAMSFNNITLWSHNDGLHYHVENQPAPRWLTELPQDLLYTSGCFDTKSKLWLSTKGAGLIIVDTITNQIDRRFLHHPDLNYTIMEMYASPEGKVWIASIGMLCAIDDNTYNQEIFAVNGKNPFTPRSTYFTSIEPDGNGHLYIGTSGGLLRINETDTSHTGLVNDPSSANSLAYNIINDLEMVDGMLWIATMGSGIDLYNPATDSFRHFTTREGLANNTIYAIEKNIDGKIWLSTNEGLVLLDPVSGTSHNFTMRDGLSSNEFVINKHAVNAKSGYLFFGSASGLVKFHPDHFANPKPSFTPVVTSLMVNYQSRPVSPDYSLQLSPAERNINFGFSVIDFRNQDKITYAYKLDGFDTAWHNVSNGNRIANFTNLPFGEYDLLVRYKISGQPWSKNVLRYHIFIETPFYATTWFMIVMIATGILIVAFVVRYISQRKLRKQVEVLRLQEQIRNEKERISRDLHDNVGAQLTYVISSLDNLSYSLNKNAVAEKESVKLEQLGEFARGTMDQLRESIWAINSEQISLSELAGRWKQYLSQLNENYPSIQIHVDRKGEDYVLKPTVAIEIHRIVQEAINNAFKHSGGNAVTVEIDRTLSDLTIEVRDNGKGLSDLNGKAGHYGLQNMKDRAGILNALMEIVSNERGTAIKLKYILN